MKLTLSSISKKFDQKVIFQDTSFTFEQGKIYGLLGRNGAGKTTLFNCIAKNLPLDGGEIGLQADDATATLAYDNTDIALNQATPQLPAFMTAFEFIRFFMDIHKEKLKDNRSPEDWLLLAGITAEDQHRLLKDFSHGMQNKVQMITSLIAQPPVLLLICRIKCRRFLARNLHRVNVQPVFLENADGEGGQSRRINLEPTVRRVLRR